MINTWFTSDTHFGHSKILEYEAEFRPFKTVEEMNECIIQRWNSVVNPNDIVYHLGDFAFGKRYIDLLTPRLRGKIRLVLGNHDTYPAKLYLSHMDRLYGVKYWKDCILTHVPVHPNQLGARAFLNVHGHLHSKKITNKIIEYTPVRGGFVMKEKMIEDLNYFNVSLEQNKLTPIHADVILDRVKLMREKQL